MTLSKPINIPGFFKISFSIWIICGINTLLHNVCLDGGLKSYNNRRRTSFFSCIPPESGYTVFSSWLFDAYYPEDEFNQAGRIKLREKINLINFDSLLNMDSTIKFTVVRHPMTRFVSSWVLGLHIFTVLSSFLSNSCVVFQIKIFKTGFSSE